MKKIAFLVIAFVLTICLVACNSDEKAICDNCGKENSLDNKFCASCGMAMTDSEEKQPTDSEEKQTVARIEIHKNPNKMNYSMADNNFDGTGMEILVVYESGKTKIIKEGFSCYPAKLTYDENYIEVSYQGKMTYLFVDFLDDRTILKIPDIFGLSLEEAEKKLKNANIQYDLVYDEAVLYYDDIAPRPTVLGVGGYHWNDEEDFDYIYEDEKITVTVNAPSIYITNVYHDINSVGGVNIRINVVNNSEKVIKYIKFNNVEFYNTVGDPAYCSIKDSYKRTLSYTGPLSAGESENIYWEAVMYNNKTSALVFRTITVEFMDGTSQTIKYDVYWWDSRYVGGYPG